MTTIHLQLPEDALQKLRDFATRQNISVDQFATSAVAEKLEALSSEEYFRMRATRGSREKFLAAMAKVPSVPPLPPDEPAR
ncbi:MAG: toxin-antitoxin system HicB family antitoxin [Pirellulaceae bacterium]|nr:toxin-antitoxin system HicB family antitoxin [Pirellulaceae bacterium]